MAAVGIPYISIYLARKNSTTFTKSMNWYNSCTSCSHTASFGRSNASGCVLRAVGEKKSAAPKGGPLARAGHFLDFSSVETISILFPQAAEAPLAPVSHGLRLAVHCEENVDSVGREPLAELDARVHAHKVAPFATRGVVQPQPTMKHPARVN